MKSRDEIFIPLLNTFVSLNLKAIENSGYPWGLFVPYGFSQYYNGNPKIFYVGIDTYYWSNKSTDLLKAYNTQDYTHYLCVNDATVTAERLLGEWAYNKGPFWEFICKMQIYIRTGILKSTDELRSLTKHEENILHEIGYGNMNAIEIPRTLQKEGYWDSISQNDYWQMVNSAKSIFQPIKNILDSYNPDIIILLGSEESDEYLFDGLTYHHKKKFDDDKWRKLYTVDGSRVKIIKTYHTNVFKYKGTNNDEMVEYVFESLKLI